MHVTENLEQIPLGPYVHDDIQHPASIFTIWTRAKKRAIGIFEVVPDPIPEGKVAIAWSLLMMDGYVRRVPELEDYVDPVPEYVEGWQAEVAMRVTLVDPESELSPTVWSRVQDIIAAMPEGIEKLTAQTVLARGRIQKNSPTLAALSAMVPLSQTRVDDLLRLAHNIES